MKRGTDGKNIRDAKVGINVAWKERKIGWEVLYYGQKER
jgi:hypothetical protein